MSRVVTTHEQTTDVLEDMFGIEPGTTVKEVVAYATPAEPTVECDQYDTKDSEIDQQFQEVYNHALAAFEFQMERADSTDVEPKYVARMHEVAAQYLNTALSAAKEKAALKGAKDKLSVKQKVAGNGSTTNTLVISHADLLDMVHNKNNVIDVN